LGFPRFPLFLGPLVKKLPEIHYPADWWIGIGATSTRSNSASWAIRKASDVFTTPTFSPLGPDQAYFRDSNGFIYSVIYR
jgi:hypothetical protein